MYLFSPYINTYTNTVTCSTMSNNVQYNAVWKVFTDERYFSEQNSVHSEWKKPQNSSRLHNSLTKLKSDRGMRDPYEHCKNFCRMNFWSILQLGDLHK